MSFSIGPMIGKRDAVIAKVQEASTGSDASQLDAVKVLILTELDQLPPEKVVSVHAWGHHSPTDRNLVIAVNQLVSVPFQSPFFVEGS